MAPVFIVQSHLHVISSIYFVISPNLTKNRQNNPIKFFTLRDISLLL
ncbi:MAG: hypothetical protein ACD_2C00014G0005 [uncultured bacterium (gcode 4)]|uniref:Uncharacterized protein n=1 Tax=uncultured bacterium (gcode 4) TaxID=1234023 RepID=K2FGL2_9BACT|nr:MAG: hypothetical protein ACD_2C00014G0005 [uncultured bacterium (gcode 4)]